MVPFQKSSKNYEQKWYHLENVPKITNKNGTIWKKVVKNSEHKWYHFEMVQKIRNKKGTI